MIVCSINLNKRMESLRKSSEFPVWLDSHNVDILFIQEASKKELNTEFFSGFTFLGGDEVLSIWCKQEFSFSVPKRISGFIQKFDVGYVTFYNIYLDAYKKRNRKNQLEYISTVLQDTSSSNPLILLGDFNIAPRDIDGIFNNKVSSFNSIIDRGALKNLLEQNNLVDKIPKSEEIIYTIERIYNGKPIRFRCDLALIHEDILNYINIKYDHTTRKEFNFTDHSALLIDVPMTLCENSLLSDFYTYYPYKTAISRKNPSSLAIELAKKVIKKENIVSILDYGCGYGKDVEFYNSIGLNAEGYDPHEKYGYNKEINQKFDCITIVYVLNVLPSPYERLNVIRNASKYLKDDGILMIATRSSYEIETQADQKNWECHNDGYWSSKSRGTFQKGIDEQEIIDLGNLCGFTKTEYTTLIKVNKNTSVMVMKKNKRE